MKTVLFATEDTKLVEELRRGYRLDFLGQVEQYGLAFCLATVSYPDAVVMADNLPRGIGSGPQTFEQCAEEIKGVCPETVVIRQPGVSDSIHQLAELLASSLGLSPRPPEDRTVVAIYSLRGGVGKSTTAANLAWELAKRSPTVLLDLDLRGGTVQHLLGVQNETGGLLRAARSWDPIKDELEGYLARSDRLALLLPPGGMEACLDESLSAGFVAELIRRLASMYSNVVVDLPADLISSPVVITALERASRILLLAQPTRAGLSGLPQFLAVAADLRLTSKLCLLLSRVRGTVDRVRLERELGIPIVGQAPEDRLVPEFEECGLPVIDNPKSPAGQALKRLAASLTEVKA